MDAVIQNAADLQVEIIRLKQQKTEQEAVIKQRFNSPHATLGTIASLFYKPKTGDDIMGWLSKLILPDTLNKTLFRRSNFVVKALVRLLSRKASHYVNNKSVGSFWDKIRSIIPQAITGNIAPKKAKPFLNLASPNKIQRKRI
jgi:hypothetical protein